MLSATSLNKFPPFNSWNSSYENMIQELIKESTAMVTNSKI
jgi:hypothetical protein